MSPFPTLRDDLGDLEGYHSARVDVDVRLNVNESPYPPPASWRDAFLEQLHNVPFNRYPDRTARALRTVIGELHGVGPEQVVVGKGSNEVIQALCLAYGGPGRTAAVFEPTYSLHTHIPRITGTAVAAGSRNPDFTLDLDQVRQVVSEAEPAITFLCTPNNPTGMVEPPEVVEAVLDLAPGLVVVDEAYAEFASWTAMSMIRPDRPLVVTRTFSKTWSMAAMRLGYLIAPATVAEACERVLLPYHLDAASQAAGRLALRWRSEMDARVRAVVAERDRVSAALARLPVEVWPSGANFILFRPHDFDAVAVWKGLVEHSVLIRDCSSWRGLSGCLRVTIGTPEEDDAFLDALTSVLTEKPARTGHAQGPYSGETVTSSGSDPLEVPRP